MQIRFRPIEVADIADPTLQEAYQYWAKVRGDVWAPSWNEIDLMALPVSLVPNVTVVDVVYNPLDFVYRFFGTGAVRVHKGEYTGKSITELPPPEYAEILIQQNKLVQKTRKPCGFVVEAPIGIRSLVWFEVIRMPLSDNGEQVDGIMSCIRYGEATDKMKEYIDGLSSDGNDGL